MSKATGSPEQEAREPSHTVIAADVVVRGDIEGPTDLHVQGRVLGKVAVTGLVLDGEAAIDGPVTAEAVMIAGHVNGSVEAKAVHVKASARVDGDVSYATLQIEAGARVSGRLIVSDAPDLGSAKPSEPRTPEGTAKPDTTASGQELVRMAARLRRVSE